MLNRIRRINGQVEAVGRMIENEDYCVDVMMQISAATGALAKVGQIVLENHLKTCVAEAMKNNEIQYIQQNKRKATKKPDSNKPDW